MHKLVLPLILLLSISLVSAHGVEEETKAEPLISLPDPSLFLIVTGIILSVLILGSLFLKSRLGEKAKKIIFILIIIPVVISTGYLAGHTIYLNIVSETGGPVHWHADFEVWVCGEKVHLPGPESAFDNKVGTAVFHHHDDDRIHVEGILIDKQDADLSQFFQTIGGSLTAVSIGIPQHDKTVKFWKNGDLCGDQQATLKVYVNGKLNPEAEEYVISPYEQIPPGDCIIVDFSPGESDTTDKVCETVKLKGGYEVYEK